MSLRPVGTCLVSCRIRAALLGGALAVVAVAAPSRAAKTHFTYLWHLEQPIYWPDRQPTGEDRYERAWQ